MGREFVLKYLIECKEQFNSDKIVPELNCFISFLYSFNSQHRKSLFTDQKC